MDTNSTRPPADRILSTESGRSELFETSGAVYLLTGHNTYNRLEYFITDHERAVNDGIPKEIFASGKPVYADVVYREGTQSGDNPIEELGFTHFREYLRSSVCDVSQEYREYTDVEYADTEDTGEICRLFSCTENFDDMADRIPDTDELEFFLKNGNVCKITVDGQIGGVFIYEDTGARSYARMLCVSRDHRNGVIGYTLFAHYFNSHRENTKLFYTWTDKQNRNSERLHSMFGYRNDGLINQIYRIKI